MVAHLSKEETDLIFAALEMYANATRDMIREPMYKENIKELKEEIIMLKIIRDKIKSYPTITISRY